MPRTPQSKSPQPPQCPAIESPLTTFARLYKTQLTMCDQLEAIADSLPRGVDVNLCLALAGNLSPALTALHAIEEQIIFPKLINHDASDQRTQRIIDRLKEEHSFDEGYGEEIRELLHVLAEDASSLDIDGIKCALRGFLESLRRHVRFDLEQVLPLARGLLNDADLLAISDILTGHQMILDESCVQTRQSIMNQSPPSDS